MIYDCPVRTNNITETLHNIMGKRFKKGNIWNFLGNVINFFLISHNKKFYNTLLTDNLQKTIVDEEIKLKRLQAGENIGCRTNIKNKMRDHKILETQKNFANGRFVIKLCFTLLMYISSK